MELLTIMTLDKYYSIYTANQMYGVNVIYLASNLA